MVDNGGERRGSVWCMRCVDISLLKVEESKKKKKKKKKNQNQNQKQKQKQK